MLSQETWRQACKARHKVDGAVPRMHGAAMLAAPGATDKMSVITCKNHKTRMYNPARFNSLEALSKVPDSTRIRGEQQAHRQ